MTDFEIFSMVAMIFSLVLRAFQLGRSFGSGKKHKKESRHPTLIGRRLLTIAEGKSRSRSVIHSCRQSTRFYWPARFPRIDCSARGFLRFRGGKGIMGWGISRKKGKAEYAK